MLAKNDPKIIGLMATIEQQAKSKLSNIKHLDQQANLKILAYHNLNSCILSCKSNNHQQDEYSRLMQRKSIITHQIKQMLREKVKIARSLYNRLADACQQFDELLPADLNYKQDNQIGLYLKECLKNSQILDIVHQTQTKEFYSLCICEGKLKASDQMIKCQFPTCQARWYHIECIGINPNKIPASKWVCKICKST